MESGTAEDRKRRTWVICVEWKPRGGCQNEQSRIHSSKKKENVPRSLSYMMCSSPVSIDPLQNRLLAPTFSCFTTIWPVTQQLHIYCFPQPWSEKKLFHAIVYYTLPYHTLQYHTIPDHTLPYHTTPYHSLAYLTKPHPTILYHTLAYHTIPYHTLQHHIVS